MLDFKVGKDATWYNDLEQGTEEWLAVRRGRVTASRIADIMVEGKGPHGFGKGAITYLNEKVSEVLTGMQHEFHTQATDWGNKHEDAARERYERVYDVKVDEVGFIKSNRFFGVSPDGLVGDEGLIEIKCPYTQHAIIEYHSMTSWKEIPKGYHAQMQAQMYVADRLWCDLCVFDTRYSGEAAMCVIRVERNEEFMEKMCERVESFGYMIEELVDRLV